MKPKYIMPVGLALLWVCAAMADTLILKDQRKFSGRIVQTTDTEVQIETKEGAVLTFPRASVGTIEKDASAPGAPGVGSGGMSPATGGVEALRSEIAQLRTELERIRTEHEKLAKQVSDLQELKDQVDKLSGTVTEIGTRASKLPPKRGDFAGTQDRSEIRFVAEKCKTEREFGEYRVHGYIKNYGTSPGVWVRIIAELQDDLGEVLFKNDINPMFGMILNAPIRDKSVLSPGEELEFQAFVSYRSRGKGATAVSMGLDKDVAPPPGDTPVTLSDTITLPLPKSAGGNVIVLKLEIPPKEYSETEQQPAGRTPGRR